MPFIAFGLMTLGGTVVLMNWACAVAWLRTGRHHSLVPLVGAVLLGAGLLLYPPTRRYAWAAPVVDLGTIAVTLATPTLLREAWLTSRFNLLEEYAGARGRTTGRLRLFGGEVCVLQYHVHLNVGESGLTASSLRGTWERRDGRLVLSVGGKTAVFQPLSTTEPGGLIQAAGVPAPDGERDDTLAGMELRILYQRGAAG